MTLTQLARRRCTCIVVNRIVVKLSSNMFPSGTDSSASRYSLLLDVTTCPPGALVPPLPCMDDRKEAQLYPSRSILNYMYKYVEDE